MSVFKKLFRAEKSDKQPQKNQSNFIEASKPDYHNFQELVEQHAGLSFEKQLVFADIIGSSAWKFDLKKGAIFFADLEFHIQIIGSIAFSDNSWMWGWANTQSGLPENLLIQSNKLKEIGQQKNIEELTQGVFNVEKGFEHKIGLMACGLFTSKSYYCANYGQGTMVVTIDDPKIPEIDKNRFEKVGTTFSQLISAIDLNHKNTFTNYLIDRDFKVNTLENNIDGKKNDQVILAEFDTLNRLTSLKAKLS